MDGFKYLRFMIQDNREIIKDITHHIRVGRHKWRNAYAVVHDKKVPFKLKRELYWVMMRSALVYDGECWPIKKIEV